MNRCQYLLSNISLRRYIVAFLASHPDKAAEFTTDAAGACVRLTGLRGAAHLNGREAVVRGADPANSARVVVRFQDGSEVKPKPSTHLYQLINFRSSFLITITMTVQCVSAIPYHVLLIAEN